MVKGEKLEPKIGTQICRSKADINSDVVVYDEHQGYKVCEPVNHINMYVYAIQNCALESASPITRENGFHSLCKV